MKIAQLFEGTKENMVPHFGLEDEGNAGKAAVALAKAGLVVDMEHNFGIFYFNFPTKEKHDNAVRIVKKVIDKTKESEW